MKPSNLLTLMLALLPTAALHSATAQTAVAQATVVQQRAKQVPSYQPSRPTFSPYLQLLRRDQGPLPNYQFFLQPRVNQQRLNQRQQQDVRGLQRDFYRLEAKGTQQFTTGIRAGFRTGGARFQTHAARFRSHQAPR